MKTFTLINTILLFSSLPCLALQVKDQKAEFYAIGKPSMLKIHGTANSTQGTLNRTGDQWSGTFAVKLADFETGMSLRDKHMREKTFQVEQYPVAELKLNPFTAKLGEKAKFTGTLKLHGVENPIQGETTLKQEDQKVNFDSQFTILLTDFKIQPPEFAGMKMNNDVNIQVSGTANP